MIDVDLSSNAPAADADIVSCHVHGTARLTVDDLQRMSAAPSAGCAIVICTYGRPSSVGRLLDSLGTQRDEVDQIIIVDASVDAATEDAVLRRADLDDMAGSMLYLRVSGRHRGLPQQRNFALDWVITDLVAFFDDDVVLLPGCLAELVRIHRCRGDVAGVGAVLQNQALKTTGFARLNRLLGMISTLRPGSYCRSGMTVAWEFLERGSGFVEGEWLPGTAAVWKTSVARQVRFWDEFRGYSLGEDLEFSLRARRFGRIGIAGGAAVLHLHDPASRPNPFALGYMEIYNRYQIQRRSLENRSRADIVRFVYAWTLDTVLLLRDLRFRGRARWTVRRICGRVKGAYDVMREHR